MIDRSILEMNFTYGFLVTRFVIYNKYFHKIYLGKGNSYCTLLNTLELNSKWGCSTHVLDLVEIGQRSKNKKCIPTTRHNDGKTRNQKSSPEPAGLVS